MTPHQYLSLREYAVTDRQVEALEVLASTESQSAAARELGINVRALTRLLSRVRAHAASKGFDPLKEGWNHPVPEPHVASGISDYYQWKDGQGNTRQQWVKSSISKDAQAKALMSMVRAMGEELPPYEPRPGPASPTMSSLLALYVLTDYHLGMYAWGEETGADWDVRIASQMLLDYFYVATRSGPRCKTAIFCNLGDMLHWDGSPHGPVTPISGHVLDADTRFDRLVSAARYCTREIVDMLLAVHEKVVFLWAEGNHDVASSALFRQMWDEVYRNEPRVEVITSPYPYYAYQHGNTGLYFHHGHLTRMEKADQVVVSEFREIYGQCKYNYLHTGDKHHERKRDTNLMIVEQHPTLATRDGWAARRGFSSERAGRALYYSDQHGYMGQIDYKPQMLTDLAASIRGLSEGS